MAGLGKIENAWSRFGSLINTGLIVVGAIGMIWNAATSQATQNNKIELNASEILRVERDQAALWTAHLQLHKDRLADVKERDGRYEQRFVGIEKDVRRIDQLEYRLAVQEQQQIATSAAIKETNNLLNGQSGDLKVMKEILQRLEANGRKELK